MPHALPLNEFLESSGPILDVRSPSEFQKGHIRGSYSFPLFSNEERAQIGTVYKKQSRQEAVELGLLLVQPKLESLLEQGSQFTSTTARVLCWRGGMRSGFIARLLELLNGKSVSTLQGGYKAYRRRVLQCLNTAGPDRLQLHVIGGLTGSGKTFILQALSQIGEQVIDLEFLAHHRGSSFGGIGLSQQPTQEQFENELSLVLERLDRSKPVWIEDESRLIGSCHLPSSLYENLQDSPLFLIQRSHSYRIQQLLAQYGQAPKQRLLVATQRIAKRLGSQLTREICLLIEKGDNELAFERLLAYYDKTYQYQVAKRKSIYYFQENELSSSLEWANILKNFYRQKHL